MSKLRTGKMNNLLKKELSWIILNEVNSAEIGFVTITNVQASPDLRQAKVYVSFIANEDDEKALKALKALKAAVKPMKKSLAQRVNLRFTPELFFYKDNTIEEMQKIDELFDRIKSESDEENIDE